ncbi:MAG: NUDIX domain-containing protein [Jatrophihabitans sp.]
MVAKQSAGILLFRRHTVPEVLLGRLGGPLWQRRRAQNWSIPKGEYLPDEPPLAAARREFAEELGLPVPDVPLLDLGTVRQGGGKQVWVWAGEAEIDLDQVVLGTFELQWPPRSGRLQTFEELAEVGWCDFEQARHRLVAAQVEFLDRLTAQLG